MAQICSRRAFTMVGAGLAGLAWLGPARAGTLPAPTDKKILTISGKIANTNDGDSAVYDRPMLEALGTSTIETSTPWYWAR